MPSGINITGPKTKKGIQKLNDMLVALSQFFSTSTHHVLMFYKLLRKKKTFNCTPKYEASFTKLKEVLSFMHPISPKRGRTTLYLPFCISRCCNGSYGERNQLLSRSSLPNLKCVIRSYSKIL